MAQMLLLQYHAVNAVLDHQQNFDHQAPRSEHVFECAVGNGQSTYSYLTEAMNDYILKPHEATQTIQ